MKKIFIPLILTFFVAIKAFSQSATAVIFAQDGEKFWVIINGIKQNSEPKANVKITGLSAPNYRLKVIFEDERIPSLDQNLYTMNGLTETYVNASYVITKNKKGKYILRGNSYEDVSAPQPGQEVINFGTEPQTNTSTPNNNNQTNNTNPANTNPSNTNTTTTNVNTTTNQNVNTSTTQTTDNVNVNVNVPGFNMNVDVTDQMLNPNMNVQVTETTTTSTTINNNNNNNNRNNNNNNNNNRNRNNNWGNRDAEPENKCTKAMSPADFNNATSSINKQSFSESKMKLAKQITQSNCLSTAQVRQIIKLFSFEADKLEYAKFAYDFTTDKNNYYMVNDEFGFSSSVSELTDFISSK